MATNREAFDNPFDADLWAHHQLISVWGPEFAELEGLAPMLVIDDLLDSERTASEIAKDVFRGNLASYARALGAGRK
jgi:hypothetical protein